MLYDDDDDLDRPALSSTHQLERADHRKKEHRETREKKERLQVGGGTRILLNVLHGLVGLVLPKNEKPDQSFKTMTHKEEEEQRTQKADSKPSPDQLLTDAAVQDQAEDAAQYEEESSASG